MQRNDKRRSDTEATVFIFGGTIDPPRRSYSRQIGFDGSSNRKSLGIGALATLRVSLPDGYGTAGNSIKVAPAEASATKMSKLYLFATTFGAGLLASSWALTFWI